MARTATAAAEDDDENIVDLPSRGAMPDSVGRLAGMIRKAREQRGWSQRTLAEAAHLNHEAVRRIEGRLADPRWSVVVRLLIVLDIDPAEALRLAYGQVGALRMKRHQEKK